MKPDVRIVLSAPGAQEPSAALARVAERFDRLAEAAAAQGPTPAPAARRLGPFGPPSDEWPWLAHVLTFLADSLIASGFSPTEEYFRGLDGGGLSVSTGRYRRGEQRVQLQGREIFVRRWGDSHGVCAVRFDVEPAASVGYLGRPLLEALAGVGWSLWRRDPTTDHDGRPGSVWVLRRAPGERCEVVWYDGPGAAGSLSVEYGRGAPDDSWGPPGGEAERGVFGSGTLLALGAPR